MRWFPLLLSLLPILFLAGCGETRAQKQQLSQAKADLVAAQTKSISPDHMGTLIGAALDRIDAFVLGTNMELPPPITPAEALIEPAVAQQERLAAAQSKADPPKGGWSAVWIWLTGAAAVGFAVARQIAPKLGPLGSLWGRLADGAWTLLAHRGQRESDTLAQRALAAAPVLITWAQTVVKDDELLAMIPEENQHVIFDLALWDVMNNDYMNKGKLNG
jgi:hypothetical protein